LETDVTDQKERIGVLGIIIEDREKSAPLVNDLLSRYGDIIVGRMGIPYREKGVHVVALIVEATTDELGALTGKLGKLPKVSVKSILCR
jgi:putative iron-only hydrogenase system regulator